MIRIQRDDAERIASMLGCQEVSKMSDPELTALLGNVSCRAHNVDGNYFSVREIDRLLDTTTSVFADLRVTDLFGAEELVEDLQDQVRYARNVARGIYGAPAIRRGAEA